MTDDSYHMPTCIGISIGISIGKIFSSVLGIESIGKKWYRSTFNNILYIARSIQNTYIPMCRKNKLTIV